MCADAAQPVSPFIGSWHIRQPHTCHCGSAIISPRLRSLQAHKCGIFKQIARFLESDTPVAVTRRGETLGVYVATPRKSVKSADMTQLRAAADRLAAALSDVDEEKIVAEFKQTRRARKAAGR